MVSRSNREIKGNAVQTRYKPDLLVEKGKKVGTGGQVNRVSPALDLLASHSKRWLYKIKMGPTQISCSDVCCPEPLLCNATGKNVAVALLKVRTR